MFSKKKEGGQWPPSSRIQGPGKIQFPAVSEEGSLNVLGLFCQWTLLPPANGIRSAIASWITPFRDHDSEAFLQPFSYQPPVTPRVVFAPAQQDRPIPQFLVHPDRIQLVQTPTKGPVVLLPGGAEPLPLGSEGFVTEATKPPGRAPGDRHGAQRSLERLSGPPKWPVLLIPKANCHSIPRSSNGSLHHPDGAPLDVSTPFDRLGRSIPTDSNCQCKQIGHLRSRKPS